LIIFSLYIYIYLKKPDEAEGDTEGEKPLIRDETVIVTDDNIADILNICNKKLQILYENVQEKQKAILEVIKLLLFIFNFIFLLIY